MGNIRKNDESHVGNMYNINSVFLVDGSYTMVEVIENYEYLLCGTIRILKENYRGWDSEFGTLSISIFLIFFRLN